MKARGLAEGPGRVSVGSHLGAGVPLGVSSLLAKSACRTVVLVGFLADALGRQQKVA